MRPKEIAPTPRAPAPAESAPIVARAAAAEPVDLTADAFVAGTAQSFAGGATTSRGSNQEKVEERTVDPNGNTSGAAGVPGAATLARPVGLDEDDWSCDWPKEADSLAIDEQVVVLRVAVRPDGKAFDVKIVADPGDGFGRAARTCALSSRFQPALDGAGRPVTSWSPSVRVRFIR